MQESGMVGQHLKMRMYTRICSRHRYFRGLHPKTSRAIAGFSFIGAAAISSKQKGHPPCYRRECPFLLRNKNLNHSDICSGRAFLPLLDVESHAVAFIERFKTA